MRKTPVFSLSSRILPSTFLFLLPLALVAGCADVQVNAALVTPTVSISASPASIARGNASMLTVKAANAMELKVTGSDGSSYNLQPSGGSVKVTPSEDTTYTATANGTGGAKSAAAAIEVEAAPVPVVSISAEPAAIEKGHASQVTVTASNATSVKLAGSNGAQYALKADGGSENVNPAATTTYTATATGTGGTASASATVTVESSTGMSVSIAASPAMIDEGETSTLTVTATKASEVTISGSDGTKYTLKGTGGSQKVKPAKTATYTATAVAGSSKVSAVATVTIAPPKVALTAFPSDVKTGESSILTVAASSAIAVSVAGTDGSRFDLATSGGKHAVSPKATTTYTATALGTQGKDTAEVTVTVSGNPAPSVTISADPASITVGGSSTVTVTAAQATEVILTGSDGTKFTLKPSGGTQSVHPAATTTYTATATGPGGKTAKEVTITVTANPKPTATIAADPATIISGNSSTLKVTASNATSVKVTGTDGSSYTLDASGGSKTVSPATTTTYTVTATGPGGTDSASATVTVDPAGSLSSIDHVIFMLQENHTFDNYFGMLNPYRQAMGWATGDDGVEYDVDGIDKTYTTISNEDDEGTSYPLFKLKSTCIDDDSSDWLASYGDVNRYNFLSTRPIEMTGFVHTAEGYAKSCVALGTCGGAYTDTTGERAMGFYDEGFLNYYYYMASQFALSDRWFSPVASKSIVNRIATFTGGTTQGLVHDPGGNDHLGQLPINNIFEELDTAKVSWKIYYTVTQGFCLDDDDCSPGNSKYPATDFSNLNYSFRYLYENPKGAACTPPTVQSSAVGDTGNSFCIDTDHIAPLSDFFTDLTNGTLPSFAFIEAGYGRNDEHPGSEQPVLMGQAQVASILNSFMSSPEWSDSVFFLSYDEGGGPYDHVPPVPGHSNDYSAAATGTYPDIASIAVNPDATPSDPTQYFPCPAPNGTPTYHCDLVATDPGAKPDDAAAVKGFAAQIGFRLPNMVISPFTRRHYVSHIPMDHTAVIKFVENRFIPGDIHLTARDAAQPDLLDFFDFNNIPWQTPPTPPAPLTDDNACTPASMGP